MQVVGVIPARAGSTGLSGKHLRLLGGQPLVTWTFAAAQASRRLSRVVLSTDDEAVAELARAHGIDVPFMRPPALATDDAPMIDVLVHAVETLEGTGPRIDAVALLQPTSPFRQAAHVDAAVDLLVATNADSVVSVIDVPHQFNPVSVMRIEDGRLQPYSGSATATRRQDKPHVVARNGPAVLVVRRDTLVLHHTLYGDHTRALPMTEDESVDIDTARDLAYAEFLLRHRASAR